MPDETPHPNGQPVNPSVKNEPSDVSFRWIFGIILGALVFAAIIHYGILLFFQGQNRYESAARKSPFPLAPAPSRQLPPEPRLEQLDRLAGSERPNVYQRQLSKEELLDSYGPTEDKGFVHIPIEQAMRYLDGKLKARPEQAEDPRASGLVDGGESNSGRMFQTDLKRKAKWSTR